MAGSIVAADLARQLQGARPGRCRGTLKDSSDRPGPARFCTIMSTTMPAAGHRLEDPRAVARPIGQVEHRDPALVGVEQDVADDDVFHARQPLRDAGQVARRLVDDGRRPPLKRADGPRPPGKPAPGRGLSQAERLMHRPQRLDAVGLVDQHGDLDVAGGDHLHVDVGGGEGGEHALGHAGVRPHAGADDRHLADLFLVLDRGAQLGGQRLAARPAWPAARSGAP